MNPLQRTPDDPIHGILGVIQRQGKLLIIQRSALVRVPLAWCFPGGAIEPGESQAQALIREMREEVRIEVTPGRLLTTQTKHDGRLILYAWSATILHGEPVANPREVADLAWLAPDEIRRQPGLLPGTVEILEQIGF